MSVAGGMAALHHQNNRGRTDSLGLELSLSLQPGVLPSYSVGNKTPCKLNNERESNKSNSDIQNETCEGLRLPARNDIHNSTNADITLAQSQEPETLPKTNLTDIIKQRNDKNKSENIMPIHLAAIVNPSDISNKNTETLPNILNITSSTTNSNAAVTSSVTNSLSHIYSSGSTESVYNNISGLVNPNGEPNGLEDGNGSKERNTFATYKSDNRLNSVTPSHIIPPTSNDRTTVTVKMFQRMDELSARMIEMEEMLGKLCRVVVEQNSNINTLKNTNETYMKNISNDLKLLESNIKVLNSRNHDEQDAFVSNLLSSITSFGSSYLKKNQARSDNNTNGQLNGMGNFQVNQSGNSSNLNIFNNSIQRSNSQSTFDQHKDISMNSTFTLNPNGIKRRKKDPNHSEMVSVIKKGNISFANIGNSYSNDFQTNNIINNNGNLNNTNYADLETINNVSSISLPNLTLEHTGITPSLKVGNSLPFAPSSSLPQQVQQGSNNLGNNNVIQFQTVPDYQTRRNENVAIELASSVDTLSDNNEEEDDGYQEDDDDDNDNDNDNEHEDDTVNKGDSNEKGSYLSIGTVKNMEYKKLSRGRSNKLHSSPSNIESSEKQRDYFAPKGKRYTLLKAPSSVRTIWEEYNHGINGEPAIKHLEDKYGNKWRTDKNRKTFARRKRLYKFILKGINAGKTAEEMINSLEDRRLYKDEKGIIKRRTIGWLQQSLSGI